MCPLPRKHALNKNVCIIMVLLCVKIRKNERSLYYNSSATVGGISLSQIIHSVAQNHLQHKHMEPVVHGTYVHTLNTHTHIHKYTDLKPGDGIDCPGDGICRQLQIRSVGFPLTFSKTCKKCPFHYWLNNVIWAPTGPNRSRQRQSSTHMLQINQITEGEWGRDRVRERGKERDTVLDT